MWHILAGEAHLLRSVFSNLLEVLSLSLPYQEKAKGQGKVSIVETTLPKAVSFIIVRTCAIFILLVIIQFFCGYINFCVTRRTLPESGVMYLDLPEEHSTTAVYQVVLRKH